jgi:type VI protein secretion system component VasF
MFVRIVNGRAYLAETERVSGRVVQRHIGPATPDMIAIVAMLAAAREELRQVERQRREEEHERDRQLAERWMTVRREFETTMQAAGYHNPNGRGWRKRQVAKSCRA